MNKTMMGLIVLFFVAEMAYSATKYEPNAVYFQTNVFLHDSTNTPLHERLPTGTVLSVSSSIIKPESDLYQRGSITIETNESVIMVYKPAADNATNSVELSSTGYLYLRRYVTGTGWVSFIFDPTNNHMTRDWSSFSATQSVNLAGNTISNGSYVGNGAGLTNVGALASASAWSFYPASNPVYMASHIITNVGGIFSTGTVEAATLSGAALSGCSLAGNLNAKSLLITNIGGIATTGTITAAKMSSFAYAVTNIWKEIYLPIEDVTTDDTYIIYEKALGVRYSYMGAADTNASVGFSFPTPSNAINGIIRVKLHTVALAGSENTTNTWQLHQGGTTTNYSQFDTPTHASDSGQIGTGYESEYVLVDMGTITNNNLFKTFQVCCTNRGGLIGISYFYQVSSPVAGYTE